MNRRPPVVSFLLKEAFRIQLAQELANLAREIKARDGCSDEEAITKAMSEYDRIVLEARRRKGSLEAAQTRTQEERQLREENKPTLKASLGDLIRAKTEKK